MSHPYDALSLDELAARRSMKWNAYPPDVLPAWVAEMDFPHAEPITRVLTEMVRAGDTGYPWAGGLAEAYAGFSRRRFGFEPDTGGAGLVGDVMRGVSRALDRLTPPGSTVAFLTPAYPPFYEFVRGTGRRVREVPLARDGAGRFALDPERVAAAIAEPDVAAFLLCHPHNPTGRVFDEAELRAVAEAALRHDVLVLSDEVHAPLAYPAADGSEMSGYSGYRPYASLGDAAAYSVSFVSASKGWNVPGLKCALAIGNGPRTRPAFVDLPIEVQAAASPLGVAANIAAFTQGDPWLDDTVAYLDGNRALLTRLLADRLPGIGYAAPEATYLAWLDCRGLGLGDDPAATFLADGRVAVNAGHDFGEAGRGFVRLNFGTSRRILSEAVERMASAVWDKDGAAE